jgi:pyruvate kinase
MQETIDVKPLIPQLETIRRAMLGAEADHAPLLRQVQPHYRESARNLLHYLALRTFDLRDIQWKLSSLGLSSIGHSERYSMINLQNILYLLRTLAGEENAGNNDDLKFTLDLPKSKRQLDRHTVLLFGEERFPDQTRIMVTLPSEAAEDYTLVRDLVETGMSVARINCAHDGSEAWERMIAHLEQAKQETGNHCLLYMDLEGPKLRTGTMPNRITKKGNKKRGFILLRKGDILFLTCDQEPGAPSEIDEAGRQLQPGRISVSLPEIFEDIQPGHTIWFDDGKMGGIIKDVSPELVVVEITAADDAGSRLYAEKGINLPDTHLGLPSLTEDDIRNLAFIVRHADMAGYSFVRTPADVEQLQAELKRLGRENIGIILKIETQETFENLPHLLLTAMKSPRVGAMIARGDLAVELGFLRIAEVQEQILWVCEAAHVPTIWATQILENMAKSGFATRAEISDAVLSVRAECAMLNKGPYILDAVRMLADIDRRMAPHQMKKQSSLRPLNVARSFFRQPAEAEKPAD